LDPSSSSSSEEDDGSFRHFKEAPRRARQPAAERAYMKYRMEGYIRHNSSRVKTKLDEIASEPKVSRGHSRMLGYEVVTLDSYFLFYRSFGGKIARVHVSFTTPKWYKKIRYTPWLKEGIDYRIIGKNSIFKTYLRTTKVTSYPNKLLSYWELYRIMCPSNTVLRCSLLPLAREYIALRRNKRIQEKKSKTALCPQ
jgi:hypothetical protein